VQWNRVRAPPVSTPAPDLHASDCLEELRPGDHFEIQWRKNKDFPYGMLLYCSNQIIYKLQCLAELRCRCTVHFSTSISAGLVHVRCLCDALQQAGGMASWVTRSRAMGTSICVAATKKVKILSPGALSFSSLDMAAIAPADRINITISRKEESTSSYSYRTKECS